MSDPAIASPVRGPVRWVRGGCVGLAATLLAALGHSLAAGMLPAPRELVLLAVGASAVGVWLSGRRWSLPALLTVLLGAQAAFHVVFAADGTTHLMPGMASTGSPATMVLAHVGAAVLTALLLARMESWCWALLDLLTTPWRVVRLAALDVRSRAAGRPQTPGIARGREFLHTVVRRRGPPVRARA